jgi:DNA-binding transcriptional regulator LsrR (DeoR family)
MRGDNELVKIALLYYEEHLTQAEIAERVGISRSLVSKYLRDAERDGIVTHVILSSSVYANRLAITLERLFGLKKAAVVDTTDVEDRFLADLTFHAAAVAFSRDILQAGTIGLTWGTTIRGFVDALPYERNQDATVVPLIGGMGSSFFELHSNQLAYDFARKLRAKCQYVYAPALVSDPGVRRSLLETEAIRDVLSRGKQADFALMGVSSPYYENHTLARLGYLSAADIDRLKTAGVAGDVNLNFFDAQGRQMDGMLDGCVIGLDIDEIKGIGKRATVCFQEERTDAVYAALDSGIVNCITLTDRIAERIIARKSPDDEAVCYHATRR